ARMSVCRRPAPGKDLAWGCTLQKALLKHMEVHCASSRTQPRVRVQPFHLTCHLHSTGSSTAGNSHRSAGASVALTSGMPLMYYPQVMMFSHFCGNNGRLWKLVARAYLGSLGDEA